MKILKILIIIGLLILTIQILTKPLGNCEACKFEYQDKELNGNQFMNIYSQECFQEEDLNLNLHPFQPTP